MKKVHFIGIGGVSMSGLAQIMLARGYEAVSYTHLLRSKKIYASRNNFLPK